MKLATQRTAAADGQLLIVSCDLKRCVPATGIATTMQDALERWDEVDADLRELYARLNADKVDCAVPFQPKAMAAPLPRAWQWLDGSAYPTHGQLMQTALGLPPVETHLPLMYQGMSHRFLGATEAVVLPSASDGIDFEAELGIVTGTVPMGTQPVDALSMVRLVVLINDWSLRAIAPIEMKTGFGWVQAKPACSMGPVAITPDELGAAWDNGRVDAVLHVRWNDARFGSVPTLPMQFGFHELMAHAALTRELCAGTIIGSGTVSSRDYGEVGSCCIAERRAIEKIAAGASQTPFMQFGDRITIAAHQRGYQRSMFGSIEQQLVEAAAVAS